MEIVALVLALVVLVLILFGVGRRSMFKGRGSLPAPAIALDAQQIAEIDGLVTVGQPILAIKKLREFTGLGLQEAKTAIDNWDPQRFASPTSADGPAVTPRDALSPEVVSEVNTLIAQGQKVQAIKIVREATGCGLVDAKNVVERWNDAPGTHR